MIDMLRQIVSTALQLIDSGKLYNIMRCDEYDIDEDSSEEFVAA